MSVSIYDIAKKANVSPATVSRALQDHPRIGAKTKLRIKALAKEMDYVPSRVAKSLYANQTWTIGIVLATIADPFMGRIVEGVEDVAVEAGFNVFLSTSQHDAQRELAVVEMFQQRRVDGIIVMASHVFDRYHQFARINLPIVVVNEQHPSDGLHFVSVNDVHGARTAVEHVLALGHRRVGYIGNTNRPKSNQFRLKGYQQALAAAQFDFDPALVYEPASDAKDAAHGVAGLEQMLEAGATAVFCYNDATAMGVLSACYGRGVRVPDDLSVIGFDDIDIAALAIPPLSTVHQPRYELGRRAMRMMLELREGQQPENQLLLADLVVRQTTAPPR